MISIRQLHSIKLGEPYTKCIENNDHALRFYQNYTQHQCYYECLSIAALNLCKCIPGYLAFDKKNVDENNKGKDWLSVDK